MGTTTQTKLQGLDVHLKHFTEQTDEATKRGLTGDPVELKRIMIESASYSGGLTAVLLQIAHPGVGRGVARHSNFSYRLVERNDNTAIFMYTMVWGSAEEKAAIRAAVDRAHVPVNDNAGAKTYDAFDPKLQLWVAATIYASLVENYEAIYGPLEKDGAERAYQQFSIMGTALQVPLSLWPANISEFRRYYDNVIQNELEVLPEVLTVLDQLFHPQHVPLWMRPLTALYMPIARAATIEQLPPAVRKQFGLVSTKGTRRTHTAFLAYNRAVYPLLPKWVRQWPKNYYLYLMRKKLKTGPLKTGNRSAHKM